MCMQLICLLVRACKCTLCCTHMHVVCTLYLCLTCVHACAIRIACLYMHARAVHICCTYTCLWAVCLHTHVCRRVLHFSMRSLCLHCVPPRLNTSMCAARACMFCTYVSCSCASWAMYVLVCKCTHACVLLHVHGSRQGVRTCASRLLVCACICLHMVVCWCVHPTSVCPSDGLCWVTPPAPTRANMQGARKFCLQKKGNSSFGLE